MKKQEELLEVIRRKIGCGYISDMRSDVFRRRAIHEMEKMDLRNYSRREIEDAEKYLHVDVSEFVGKRKPWRGFLKKRH